jgi:hypothetical protein
MSPVSRALSKAYHQLTATENKNLNTVEYIQVPIPVSPEPYHLDPQFPHRVPKPWTPPGFDPVAGPVRRCNRLIGYVRSGYPTWYSFPVGRYPTSGLVVWWRGGCRMSRWSCTGTSNGALNLERGWFELVIGYFLRFPDRQEVAWLLGLTFYSWVLAWTWAWLSVFAYLRFFDELISQDGGCFAL